MCGRHEQCGHQEADMGQARGSFLQGHVNVKFDELVAVFGFPHGLPSDGSQVEWVVKFDDGTVATIYDWQQEANHWDVTEWHVGGFKRDAWFHVNDTLKQAGFSTEYRRFQQVGS